MFEGLKNIYVLHLILTLPTPIFSKVCVHYRGVVPFIWGISSSKTGVCIMHEFTLCNDNDGISVYVYCMFFVTSCISCLYDNKID
jgi:hypothetical protein